MKHSSSILDFRLCKKTDISARKYRWLTVVSPEDQDGAQLVLEPNDNPAAEFLSRNRPLANITTGKLFR